MEWTFSAGFNAQPEFMYAFPFLFKFAFYCNLFDICHCSAKAHKFQFHFMLFYAFAFYYPPPGYFPGKDGSFSQSKVYLCPSWLFVLAHQMIIYANVCSPVEEDKKSLRVATKSLPISRSGSIFHFHSSLLFLSAASLCWHAFVIYFVYLLFCTVLLACNKLLLCFGHFWLIQAVPGASKSQKVWVLPLTFFGAFFSALE